VGGDSILAIQVIAKARQAGIWLSPHQLFRHQTIGELAAVARIVGAMTSAQEAVTGPVPLTPIQHWFFEAFAVDRHHWNQALAFEVGQPLDAAKLRVVFHRLVEHHDALRTRFTQTQGAWSQSVAAPAAGDADAFSLIDLTALAAEACPASFTAAASRLQASFDLERGPLVRLALFTGPHGWQRLFLVAHHLVIDGVSWRILLADLVAAYQQMQRGETVELPRKTTSFKRWAEYLAEQVRAGAFSDEGEHWREAREEVAPPVDHRLGENLVASANGVAVALGPERTRALLQEVPAVYNTQINDVLLTALAAAVKRWTGRPEVWLELEGHGREDLSEEIDLSRTVGWFTCQFPVCLTLHDDDDPGAALRSVKEQLRRIPSRGIGYGLLRYLGTREGNGRPRLAASPRISFNYLGQMDQVLPGSSPLRLAPEPTGPWCSPAGVRAHELEINGWIVEGRLETRWTYSESLHRRETIARLAGDFIRELEALIEHCQSPGAGGYTASDFPLAQLDEERLREISGLLEQIDHLELAGSEE
jgi:non-ribosomal peptide synthase protein (TIGR01720 family)